MHFENGEAPVDTQDDPYFKQKVQVGICAHRGLRYDIGKFDTCHMEAVIDVVSVSFLFDVNEPFSCMSIK